MRSTRLAVSILVCLLLLSAKTLLAQAELDCLTLVEQSLSDFGVNCGDVASGMACYGHPTVQAETNSANTTPFSNPADQLPLSSVARLSTSGADPTDGTWGLALANMIPADATESVQIVMMGETTLTLAPTAPTSLQFTSGFGAGLCADAPSVSAIATQQNVLAMLKINGIDVQATGLVVFQQESANAMKALVYSGSLTIAGGGTALAGQTLAGVMDNNGTILFWSAPRPSTDTESQITTMMANTLNQLGLVQATPMPPTATPIPPTSTPEPVSSTCGSGVTHVVQVGENLFRIAMRYGTSIDAISQANGITDINQIVVGQTLVIPCGVDSGSPSVAPGSETTGSEPTTQPSTDSAAAPPPSAGPGMTIDCTGFNGQLPPGAPPAFQDLFNQFCQ